MNFWKKNHLSSNLLYFSLGNAESLRTALTHWRTIGRNGIHLRFSFLRGRVLASCLELKAPPDLINGALRK